MKNPFESSERKRKEIVDQQKKDIKNLYKEVHDEFKKEIRRLEKRKDSKSILRASYLKSLKNELNGYMKFVDMKTERLVKDNMNTMVNSVVRNNQSFVYNLGFDIYTNNSMIKKSVVERILTGTIYDGKWNLSSAIWGDNEKKKQEINRIIAKGVLRNKGVYDIAKDLERYVNPNARKDYDWSAMFPGSRKKVDYNAQRLARTMISHAYEEAFVEVTKDNPFIESYRWVTSGGHNVCALCIDRETIDHFGLGPGIYPKNKLPLDHPNGMCTFELVMSMSDKEIADAITDWYLGEGDELMNEKIDIFINNLKKF